MNKVYPMEVREFIAKNVVGTSNEKLVQMIQETFGITYTEKQIKSYKENHKLKSGTKYCKKEGTKLFPKEVREFIKENVAGNSNVELTEMVNNAFHKDYSANQIKRFKNTHKIKSGLDGRFVKGQKPIYIPPKGTYAKGCEKGWFEKGGPASNLRPIGSERFNSDYGYVMVKTGHPNKWEHKHKVLWREHYGEIPEGYKLVFLDQDTTNIKIENLALVRSDELLIANRKKLIFKDPEVTKTGVMLSKLMAKRNRIGREKHQKA